MTIFNKLYQFYFVLLLGTVFSVKAGFYTREIDLHSDFEVTQVAQELFYREHKICDAQTRLARPMNYAECHLELIRAKQELFQKASGTGKIFVCVSIKENQIYGILCCQHGHRKVDMAEYTRSKVCNSCWKFWSGNNFDSVMQSMTQHAKDFYRGMSMKSIAVHVMSKDEASFYTKFGYRLLSEQEANNLYWTTTDNVMFLLGLPFLIALFPIYALYKASDWGIFYKEL